MGTYGSGGHNKTHERLESYIRIDSFSLQAHCKGKVTYPIWGGNIAYYLKTGSATISYNGRCIPLRLSKVTNIDGVSYRLYFHCPACGKRVRYLYERFGFYICRKCAKLNYRIQQANGLRKLWLKMFNIVEKELGYTNWDVDYPNASIEDLLYIPKPRYMRWDKYERHMQELRDLQKAYKREFFKGLLKSPLIPDDMAARISEQINF